ncbi:MAG: hypothetical protein KDE27_23885 [Planctomycetes bacterium]|nr:hypothetical protein [Planctomycetota bacterium]
MRPSPRAYAASLLTALAASLLGSCSTIRTSGRPDFDLKTIKRYAWLNPPSFSGEAVEGSEVRLLTETRSAIDNHLQRLGVRPSTHEEAEVLVTATLDLAVRLHLNDFDYDLFAAENEEVGTLTITFFDRGPRQAWTGRCRHTLRTASRSEQPSPMEFVPTGQTRDWRIAQMVERILSRASTE